MPIKQGNISNQKLVAVGTAATLISDAGQYAARVFVNEGDGDIRIGTSTVTASGAATDGLLIKAGAAYSDDVNVSRVYAICAAGGSANVSVLEIK